MQNWLKYIFSFLILLVVIAVLLQTTDQPTKGNVSTFKVPQFHSIIRSRDPDLPVRPCPQIRNDFIFTKTGLVQQATRFPSVVISKDNITSPQNTKVTLLNPQASYNICDTIIVQIEARDSLNRTKGYGGDMFRITLFSENPYAALSPEHFVDFNNGTYVAVFHLYWEGLTGLDVLLVHPAEAIPLFRPTLDGTRVDKSMYSGDFTVIRNGTTITENTICTSRELEKPFCNFSDPHNYAPWFCGAPQNPMLNCRNWVAHRTDVQGLFKGLGKDLDEVGIEILNRARREVLKANDIINVTKTGKDTHVLSGLLHDQLPYCASRGPPPMKTNGYFYGRTWFPLDCKVHDFTETDLMTCLRGKTVLVFGDSTSRQLYEFLSKKLACKKMALDPPRKESSREFRCSVSNITLHFHFHGFPNGHSVPVPAYANHYAASEIDKVKGGPNMIIILSYWAHFGMHGIKFLEKRINSVREALIRLERRDPGTRVVVKGTNTRDYFNKPFQLVFSDWHTYIQEIKLREWLKNDIDFGYIDSWEITRAQSHPDKTHPPKDIVENFVNRMMTYICINGSTNHTHA